MVCVVEIFTTEGISFSARSAKESGIGLAFKRLINPKLKRTNVNNIFLKICIYFFIYQTIKNPNIKKKTPTIRNLFSGIFSIALNIFFILVGKMAKNNPSIKRSKPKAEIKSFIKTN